MIGLAVAVSLSPLASSEAQADKRVRRPKRDPKPKPKPTPPGSEQADEIGNSGIVPPTVESRPSEEGGGESLVEATATVWAMAGSRSWTGCSAIASEASKQLWTGSEDANTFQSEHRWALQAEECPNTPEVLALAVRTELMRRLEFPPGVDGNTQLDELESELATSRGRALRWIELAEDELTRRRERRSLGLDYWRGRALLALADYEPAKAAFERALREGSADGWRVRRLQAVCELYAGNLEAAVELAARAVNDSPSNDRIAPSYVLALALDRAGDPSGAARRMRIALTRDGDGGQLRSLQTALPLHERLYLAAYAMTVRNDTPGALRLWAAYLARSEPEEPERRLAERHMAALRPVPRNLGGPAKAGEAPAPAVIVPVSD